MDCETFLDWLGVSRGRAIDESPSASAHYESCAACRHTADEERLWQKLFGSIPAPSTDRSLWPRIAFAIGKRQNLRSALSDALLFFSRRLAPAFVILLVIVGIFLWNAPRMEAARAPMIAMLETGSSGFIEEPDAILVSWVEAREE